MSPRERRALRLGGAVIVAAFAALRLLPWGWHAAQGRAEEFRNRAELLVRAEAMVAAADELQDSSVAVKARLLTLAPRILAGSQEAEAMADLSGRLNALAAAHQVRLSRTNPLSDSTRSGELRRISVRVTLESDSRGTLEFLRGLARGPAVLVLQELRVTAPNAASAAAVPEVLETEATVQGWYLARGSAP